MDYCFNYSNANDEMLLCHFHVNMEVKSTRIKECVKIIFALDFINDVTWLVGEYAC